MIFMVRTWYPGDKVKEILGLVKKAPKCQILLKNGKSLVKLMESVGSTLLYHFLKIIKERGKSIADSFYFLR